jgi:hypothetical protein
MNNTVKNAIRHLVCKAYDAFAQNKTDISVTSLPGSSWEFEKYVINHKAYGDTFGNVYSLQMSLFECNSQEYQSNLRPIATIFPHNKTSAYILNHSGVTYKNEYINADSVKSLRSKNIFAWFDFCGNPTEQNLDLIKTAKDRTVTFVFTFNTHWRCDSNISPIVINTANEYNKGYAIQCYLLTLAIELGLSLVWSFEYVSNQNPMMTICVSNDMNVITNRSLQVKDFITHEKKDKKINLNKTKLVLNKRELSAVYADLKERVSDSEICNKHNISTGTLAACKAWMTMWKAW